MPTDYHGRIMNIEAHEFGLRYKSGHKDARHAAAEIALEADAEIARLREALSWYYEEVYALARNTNFGNHVALEAGLAVLRLDKGDRARAALESGDE